MLSVQFVKIRLSQSVDMEVNLHRQPRNKQLEGGPAGGRNTAGTETPWGCGYKRAPPNGSAGRKSPMGFSISAFILWGKYFEILYSKGQGRWREHLTPDTRTGKKIRLGVIVPSIPQCQMQIANNRKNPLSFNHRKVLAIFLELNFKCVFYFIRICPFLQGGPLKCSHGS